MEQQQQEDIPNPLGWGEIENVARHYFLRPDLLEPDSVQYGTLKLDGTNLGICVDGRLFGRHFLVMSDKYGGVSLTHLRESCWAERVRDLRSRLCVSLGWPATHWDHCDEFIVYGEFGIRRECLYPQTSALLGKWCAFGIKFRCPASQGEGLRDRLASQGHYFKTSLGKEEQDQQIQCTLFMTPRLKKLLEECQLPSVPILFEGPLKLWIEEASRWLIRTPGRDLETMEEGLVIVSPQHRLLKWKCSLEVQPQVSPPSQISNLSPDQQKILDCIASVIQGAGSLSSSLGLKEDLKKDSLMIERQVLAAAMTKFNTSDWEESFDRLAKNPKSLSERLKFLKEEVTRECLTEYAQVHCGNPGDAVPFRIQESLKKLAGEQIGRVFKAWKTTPKSPQ